MPVSKPRESSILFPGYAEIDDVAPGLPRSTKPFRDAELAESLRTLMGPSAITG
ncbi:MAG: hypothetical protein M3Q08_14495 [Pseudomonadota bacterium]|nr:hypothetical protein [Pseudomonadota bacterium]